MIVIRLDNVLQKSYLAMMFFATLLLGSSVILADATPPCMMGEPKEIWHSYDDIYTGKVVSISNQIDEGVDSWLPTIAGVRIDFELEHLLKGNPHTSWHINVPLETYCPGDFCVSGADHYTIGSEIFYINGFNGNGYPFGGACGISEVKAEHWMVQEFFDYFEEIYGVPVKKSFHTLGDKTKCDNSEHLPVLRDNNKRACVSEKTSQKMNWNIIENIGIQFQNITNTEIKYDYPLSSKTTQVTNSPSSPYYQFDSEITLSKLPKIGETATIVMTYTNLEENSQRYEEDTVHFTISENFRFTNIDEKDIEHSHDGSYSYYSEEFPSIKQHHENTFSVTIKAVSEGYGSISVGGRGYQHQFMVFVDRDQTLLVEDYYKLHYPVPNMQTFTKQTESVIQIEPTIIPPKQNLLACKFSADVMTKEEATCEKDRKHFEYGYKVLYGNDTPETKYDDYQIYEENPVVDVSDSSGSEAHNVMDSYKITIPKLPTLNKTGEMVVSFITIDDSFKFDFIKNAYMFMEISNNLDFVGIPADEIENLWNGKKRFVYPDAYVILEPDQTHTLFATIKALKTGTGEISVYVGTYGNHLEDKDQRTINYEMVIGDNETLLMDDYYKKYLSVPLNISETEESSIVINTSWWAGECIGRCSEDITLTSNMVVYHSNGDSSLSSSCPEIRHELPFSEEEWQSLIKLVDLEKFYELPDVIGSPGETDGAIVYIEIFDGERSKRITFETPDELPEVEEFVIELKNITDDLSSKYYSHCLLD